MNEISQNNVLIPIIIGMTGHRDLIKEEIPELESKVRIMIKSIQLKYKNSPIVILSPLAEGADRLVARVGLQLGARLYAILPMPQEEYEKDFSHSNSIQEFSEFLDKAEMIIRLPLAEGNTPENIKEYNNNRNLQYELAGSYTVEHSQIFIALWDGTTTKKKGGTAKIIKYRLEGTPLAHNFQHRLLNMGNLSSVYHIHTNRTSQNPVFKLDFEYLLDKDTNWNILFPERLKEEAEYHGETGQVIIEKQKDFYHRLLKRVDEFNADAIKALTYQPLAAALSRRYIYAGDVKLSENLNKILDCYAVTDTLAINYQKNTRNSKLQLISLAFFGFLFLTFFDEILSSLIVLSLAPITFLVAYVLYRVMVRKNFDNKYYDYRALAEGLRIQFFWKLSGWQENSAQYYLNRYEGEINWISFAITSVSLGINNELWQENDQSIRIKSDRITNVYRYWVGDQKSYFKKRSLQKTKSVARQAHTTTLFFFLSMTGVLAMFLLQAIDIYINKQYDFLNMDNLSSWSIYHFILLFMDIFIALGAAYSNYVSNMAFAEEARNYQKMSELFFKGERLIRLFIETQNWENAKMVIIELGKDTLSENEEWLLTKRTKPIEIPTG